MKPVEPVRVQDQINVFGESGIAIGHQGYCADYHIIDLMFLQVSNQTSQSIVEFAFTHEVTLTFSVDLRNGAGGNICSRQSHFMTNLAGPRLLEILLDLPDNLANLERTAFNF